MSAAEISVQEAASELLRRRRARTRLLDFTLYTKPDYDPNWHHVLLFRYLDRFISGAIKRLMVFMPPQNGKSEAVSRRLPAFALGQNPKAKVMACSYSADLAGMLNREVQRIIEDKPYVRLFPNTRLPRQSAPTSSAVEKSSSAAYTRNSELFEIVDHGGYCRSAGVRGGITGLGFNYGIIDDPFKNDEEAYSPTIREAVYTWYTGTFWTRQAPNAGILLTNTRWHRDDLAGRLLKDAADNSHLPHAEEWVVLRLPCVQDRDPTDEDPRQRGEVLWPSRYDQHWVENTRRTQGAIKFAAMYQQDPKAEGGSEWPESYFGSSIWFDDFPQDLWFRCIALDPSKGKDAKHGDYSALVMLGIDSSGTMWVEANLERRRSEIIVEQGIEHFRRFQAHDGLVAEVNQYQELLADEFDRVSGERGVPLPIFTIDNRVNKVVRIRRLGPYLAKGRIRFKANSPGTRLLVDQLRDFPNGEHDDGPDALEMAIRHARENAVVHDDRDEAEFLFESNIR